MIIPGTDLDVENEYWREVHQVTSIYNEHVFALLFRDELRMIMHRVCVSWK